MNYNKKATKEERLIREEAIRVLKEGALTCISYTEERQLNRTWRAHTYTISIPGGYINYTVETEVLKKKGLTMFKNEKKCLY